MYSNDSEKQSLARKIMQRKARDNARTPVQWSDAAHAGFTTPSSTPWMRVNDDYTQVNVAFQLSGPKAASSVHAFWQRSLAHRKQNKDLYVYGDFEAVENEDVETEKEVFAYRRWSAERSVLVLLNFCGKKLQWRLGELRVEKWVKGNYEVEEWNGKEKSGAVTLEPWEGLVGELA